MKKRTVVSRIAAGMAAVGCFACVPCSDHAAFLPEAPDYADSCMWYRSADTLGKRADVFYIAPTCVWSWPDERGDTCHYMNVRDVSQRAAVDGSNRLAAALFGESCRFFSPYYRQITMNVWFEPVSEIDARYAVAHGDVVRAFEYYMEHFNEGRPFLLAGHSQGAKAVVELLKHGLTEEQYGRMVAAYVFGFSIDRSELSGFPLLKPAADSADCGVVVCFNSVSDTGAVSPLFRSNAVCINPLNWRTDTAYAPASANAGSVFFRASGVSDTLVGRVGARIDTVSRTLVIDGLDDEDYYIPSIGTLFPKGNYHVQELNLYFLNIQRNIGRRIDAFASGGPKSENGK